MKPSFINDYITTYDDVITPESCDHLIDFFEKNKEMFDVIFIDGLHLYSQCQKDCINSLKFLKDDGFIIFHDFLPRNAYEENVPPKQKEWSGDIWKVAVEINNSLNKDFFFVI